MSETRSSELDTAYDVCRAIARREAKNFYYAFRVLPRDKSDAMCAIYAFMRRADDLADDESMTLEERRKAMSTWTADWRASRTMPTRNPIFTALSDAQKRFSISDDLLEQLVAGTTLDLAVSNGGVSDLQLFNPKGEMRTLQIYENFAALQHYCYLVASVVGLVCIRIFGYSDTRAEQLAIDTGIAFQLTNILRDIKEDVDRGRIYISADLLRENNVLPDRVLALCAGDKLEPNERKLLRGLELHAETLYRSSTELIPLLDADSRPAMLVLVQIYSGLLNRIAIDPEAIFRGRVSVPRSKKMSILAVGFLKSWKVRLLG